MVANRTFVIRPPLQTPIEEEVHASTGSGRPYPKEVREMVLQRHQLGLPQLEQSKFYSNITCIHHKGQFIDGYKGFKRLVTFFRFVEQEIGEQKER